jgi:hypothetical protein
LGPCSVHLWGPSNWAPPVGPCGHIKLGPCSVHLWAHQIGTLQCVPVGTSNWDPAVCTCGHITSALVTVSYCLLYRYGVIFKNGTAVSPQATVKEKLIFLSYPSSILTFYTLLVTWCTNSLTFNNCTLCPHCIYVFCIYLRTYSVKSAKTGQGQHFS